MPECPGPGEAALQSCSSLGVLLLGLFLPSSIQGNDSTHCKHSCGQRFQRGAAYFMSIPINKSQPNEIMKQKQSPVKLDRQTNKIPDPAGEGSRLLQNLEQAAVSSAS